MAYYIKNKKQTENPSAVRRARNRRAELIAQLPVMSRAKTVIALLGFLAGAVMMIYGFRQGIIDGQGVSAGMGSLISGVFTCIGALVILMARHAYLPAGAMVPLLLFTVGLLVPLLQPDAARLARGISLSNAAFMLASGMVGKTQYEAMKRIGLRK
jgi:hypothetical protein